MGADGPSSAGRWRLLTVFLLGLVAGFLMTKVMPRFEHDYWRDPGWFTSEIPSLHAWGLRLMQNGGPGRDGFHENHLPDTSADYPSYRLGVCWQTGELVLMRYTAWTDTLTAIYRCERDELGGQLNVILFGPKSSKNFDDVYVFSVFDPTQDPGLNHLDIWEQP